MESMTNVKIWEEACLIPTYPVYPPEKSPLFIEKRAYQGSTGKVYPLPVTEKISDVKKDVKYRAVYLENEYLKVMILPELGGRIQRAYDKTNGYDFVYYNHVIKPALVGLTGPWISGGIEFNWPQHHRPSTYSPVDYALSENPDGSGTVYVGEIDKMYGTKGMAAISLYPGKAYIEVRGQLYNHTDLPQTFLWWANPAVPVNDNTYSIFPPDVNAVMDHGKRAVSTFPIATGEYYKCDYSAGVDISRYKNIKVPTSYMAAHSDFDFIGNYDEGLEAGLLHVADHHISPGKKQWTWGNGDFGRTWDRNLTDEDGPYIELMTGVFADNQPDFTWLKPHEEKTFVQYFMPYKGVGRVGNATKEAMVSITEGREGFALLKVYATADYPGAEIKVTENGRILYEGCADLSPRACYVISFPISDIRIIRKKSCRISVSYRGELLVDYNVYERHPEPIPSPAENMKSPEELKSTEELYLAAVHLEQYRHATYEPADYYLEGLCRDSTDIRLNNGYGLLLFKRGCVKESIPYFKAAIKKQTWKTPNPYYGECCFNLGLALEAIGQEDKAYEAFYKSTWSAETQSAGFYWLANLAARRGNYEKALTFVSKSLLQNWHNMKARNLKAAIMRMLKMDTSVFLRESLEIDPLYMGCLYEQAALDSLGNGEGQTSDSNLERAFDVEAKCAGNSLFAASLNRWKEKMRKEAHNYLELSLDYIKGGFYKDALNILEACPEENPMRWYYQGYVYEKLGNGEAAGKYFTMGEEANSDYCFPNRVEEIAILEAAAGRLSKAPMAHYYLGNLLYDKKQYELARMYWEKAVEEKNGLSMAYRNLSIVYFNKEHNGEKALAAIEKACLLDKDYPRFLLEYDQLAAKLNQSNTARLQRLEKRLELTTARDDLYLRYITLLNCEGRHEEALDALKTHRFHPWEGGEGKVSAQYRYALVELAKKKLAQERAAEALELLVQTITYPENLGEGKLPNVPDNQAHYYMGIASRMLGDIKKAEEFFELAASGPQEPERVLYYNDQPSDFIFYQGLANQELGREDAAKKAYHQLIFYGEKHLFDEVSYDYFAVSLPEIEVYQDDIKLRNIQYCNYLRALGAIGLGENKKASELFEEILQKQADHQGALSHWKAEAEL